MTTAQVPGSLQRHPLEIVQGVSRWLERRPLVAALVLAAVLLAAYWWQREFMPGRLRSLWGPYFVAMLGWVAAGGLGVYLYRVLPRAGTDAAVDRRQVLFVAAVVGVFLVSLQMITGMLAQFGNSPYAHTPRWLLTNLFFGGSLLAAIEISRAALLNALGRKSLPLALFATSVGLAALQFGTGQYTPGGFTGHMEFWGADFIPAVSLGLLVGFFALYGGVFAGLLVAAPIVAFTYYSPILPVADWPIMALVGVAGPAMGLWIADGLFSTSEQAEEEAAKPRTGIGRFVGLPSVAWMLTALVSLSIFWFSFGFFGYMPSFVPSHSMEPNIQQGDVVLTGPVDAAEIETGDVVLYEMVNGQRVLHRVIEIEAAENGEPRYILQGDNNNTADLHPVEPDQVMGQYMGRVPHAGWLPIKFNELVLERLR